MIVKSKLSMIKTTQRVFCSSLTNWPKAIQKVIFRQNLSCSLLCFSLGIFNDDPMEIWYEKECLTDANKLGFLLWNRKGKIKIFGK